MDVYERIKRGRRTVVVTAVLVYVLAVGGMTASVIAGNLSGWHAVAVAVAVTLPATLALVSLDRRPSLLPAAWMAAIVSGVTVIESAPIWIVVAIIWAFVVRSRPRQARERRWMTWVRPLLAASVFVPVLLLMAHADPVCTATYPDGRVEHIDPATRGLEEGWRLWGTTGQLTGTTTSGDTVSEECASDTVVWWEALMSLVASSLVVFVASRWPTARTIATSADEALPRSLGSERAGHD